MHDINEIRRLNLIALLNGSVFDGNMSKLARALGKEPPNIYRIINKESKDVRSIGEKLARQIEKKLNLPQYWLDQEQHGSDNPMPVVTINLEKYQSLIDDMEWLLEDEQASIIQQVHDIAIKNKKLMELLNAKANLIADSGQRTADSGQRTADSGQRTADSGQRTAKATSCGHPNGCQNLSNDPTKCGGNDFCDYKREVELKSIWSI